MSEKPWLDFPEVRDKDVIRYFGHFDLSYSELDQNLHNISEILGGKKRIDFIGKNGLYFNLLCCVAQNKGITINCINLGLDPTEIANRMVSDTLVVAELPAEITENIIDGLSGKKNVIVGTLYKEEKIVSDSGSHK